MKARRLFLLFALTSFLLCPSGFSAEAPSRWSLKRFLLGEKEAPPESQEKPPVEVTVVASRLPSLKTPYEEISANVSYKSKEDFDRVHPLTFQEAVKDLEGVVLFDSVGNDLDTTFGLRGFTDPSAVVFLVDGVRVNELDGDIVTYPLLILDDAESIQVDRGSASPIYGSGAFAGVVHLTTGQPSEKPVSLFGGFEGSSFGRLRFYQGLSGTIQDRWSPLGGKFKYYFRGGRNVGDGWRPNSEWRITSFDIKSSYELPEERGKLYFNLKHVHDAVSNPGEMTFQQFKDNPDRSNKPLDGRDFEATVVQLGADAKFWEKRISASIMADWRIVRSHFFSTSGTFIDFTTGANPNTDRVTTKSRRWDLTWQLGYEDEWEWLANQSLLGMEFRNGVETDLREEAFQGIVRREFPAETDRKFEPSNVSLFWRESLKFFDRVIPHVGMRYDRYWLHTEDFLDFGSNVSGRWTNVSWSTGLTVKPVESLDLFGNYSQGFRTPTVSELAPFAAGINTELQPETSDSYEVGTRLRFGEKGTAKFSYFLIDLKDEIVFDTTSVTAATPFGRNINIGKSRRTGIETSLKLKPVQEAEFYGTYTWTKAFVRETDAGGALVDGRALGQVPEHRFTLGIDLWPLKRLGDLFKEFRVGLYGVFTGSQPPSSYESTDQATLDATGGAGHRIKPFSVWDFIVSYKWRGMEIYFKINNLFDERYYSRSISATSFGTSIYPFGTFTFVNPGAPREYVLGTRWEF
jgi:outer membrane receptor protein involved in Fe transport